MIGIVCRRSARGLPLVLAAAVLALAGCGSAKPFDPNAVPPAPDYSQPVAWLAFPGDNGSERSTPPGMAPVAEADAPADVFFIHPTTYGKNDVPNAAYDSANVPLAPVVRMAQASAFNGCCRIYAPHYRQASLEALGKEPRAVALAYADVASAFRWYIAHENHGRPFIIAGHSQGAGLMVQLLQQEVLGAPLQGRLVAAYVIGAYAPSDFAKIGLPTCDAPRQTGCIVAWNTAQAGRKFPRILIDNKTYWWQGSLKSSGQPPAICVNPLTWTQAGAAGPDANLGSLPLPAKPYPTAAAALAPLVPHLTGAKCRDGLLTVDIPSSAPEGFHDTLSRLTGSYHLNDYGIFYAALRANAVDRVGAWTAAHPSAR